MPIKIRIVKKPKPAYPPDIEGFYTVAFKKDMSGFFPSVPSSDPTPLFGGFMAPAVFAPDMVDGQLIVSKDLQIIYIQDEEDATVVYENGSWTYGNVFYFEDNDMNSLSVEMLSEQTEELPGSPYIIYSSVEEAPDYDAFNVQWNPHEELSFTGMSDKTWEVDVLLVRYPEDYDDGGEVV